MMTRMTTTMMMMMIMMYEVQRGVTAAAAECSYGDGIHGDVLAGKT